MRLLFRGIWWDLHIKCWSRPWATALGRAFSSALPPSGTRDPHPPAPTSSTPCPPHQGAGGQDGKKAFMGLTETSNQAEPPSHGLRRPGCWAPALLQAALDHQLSDHSSFPQVRILHVARITSCIFFSSPISIEASFCFPLDEILFLIFFLF